MPLTNAPKKFVYRELPETWTKKINSHVFSNSHQDEIQYDTPKYKGTILWEYNTCYGDLPKQFDFNGERLQANNGHKLNTILNIPDDYCIRTGKDGWMKLLTKEYFEMWLMD